MDRLAAMETLVRVIETGSFSAAARQLGVGQPAVSKTVAQLEERLGVRLLLRSSRGLTPTEAGQSFYERAKRALEEADEADSAARGAGAGLSGRLRFSAAVTFARLQIVPRLPTVPGRAPGALGRGHSRRPQCRPDRGGHRRRVPDRRRAGRRVDDGAQDRAVARPGARHARLFRGKGRAPHAGRAARPSGGDLCPGRRRRDLHLSQGRRPRKP